MDFKIGSRVIYVLDNIPFTGELGTIVGVNVNGWGSRYKVVFDNIISANSRESKGWNVSHRELELYGFRPPKQLMKHKI